MTLILPVEKINKEFRKDLVKALKSNKGKKLFNLNVLDYTNQLAVEFFSRKYKIDVTPELLDFIEHQNLDYKVEKEVYL
jgi:DNA polymerase-3 subunit alpha